MGQKLADLPLYSGIEYRAFCFVVFLIVTNIYLVKYAKEIRKNPSLSPMYELDLKDASSIKGDLSSIEDMKLRDYLVMLSLVGTLIVIVYGGMNLGWGLAENTMAFVWLGITRQTVLLAYNFGDRFCNYVLPTSTALMGILSVSNIPYDKWMKFMWKLFLIWIAVGSLLMLGAKIINLGPM